MPNEEDKLGTDRHSHVKTILGGYIPCTQLTAFKKKMEIW